MHHPTSLIYRGKGSVFLPRNFIFIDNGHKSQVWQRVLTTAVLTFFWAVAGFSQGSIRNSECPSIHWEIWIRTATFANYIVLVACHITGGRFKKTYELLNLRALKISPVNKIHIFQCMGKIFCAEFQRYPWNSTQNILPIHWKVRFLYNIGILRALRFKSSYAFFKRPPPPPRPVKTKMDPLCIIVRNWAYNDTDRCTLHWLEQRYYDYWQPYSRQPFIQIFCSDMCFISFLPVTHIYVIEINCHLPNEIVFQYCT